MVQNREQVVFFLLLDPPVFDAVIAGDGHEFFIRQDHRFARGDLSSQGEIVDLEAVSVHRLQRYPHVRILAVVLDRGLDRKPDVATAVDVLGYLCRHIGDLDIFV